MRLWKFLLTSVELTIFFLRIFSVCEFTILNPILISFDGIFNPQQPSTRQFFLLHFHGFFFIEILPSLKESNSNLDPAAICQDLKQQRVSIFRLREPPLKKRSICNFLLIWIGDIFSIICFCNESLPNIERSKNTAKRSKITSSQVSFFSF